jgi:hypothetical protein
VSKGENRETGQKAEVKWDTNHYLNNRGIPTLVFSMVGYLILALRLSTSSAPLREIHFSSN